MEKVSICIDPADPSPASLRGWFAEVLSGLDARPRRLMVSVCARNDFAARVSVEIEKGEPVFRVEGRGAARADYGGRWLAEHPSPLRFSARGRTALVFSPTAANRVKVRRATLAERIFR